MSVLFGLLSYLFIGYIPKKGTSMVPGKVCRGCVRAYRAWYLEVMGLEYLIFGI